MLQFHGDMSADDAPDWMPAGSARNYREGEVVISSVGQRWQNRGGYWVRIKKLAAVENKRPEDLVMAACDELHRLALARVEKLMDAHPGTPEGDELNTLSAAVEAYETLRWPI